MKTTAIILCGGKERRFGRNKATVMVGGKRVIDRVVERLSPLANQVLLVTSAAKAASDEMRLGEVVEVMTDEYPGKGPLGGIYTGLTAAVSSPAIVVGCDMPFLNTHLLEYMLQAATGFDVVIPRLERGMVEPLHAVYSRSCLSKMKARLQQDNLAITPLLAELKVRHLEKDEYGPFDPDMLSFFNINYPEDLERANEIAEQADIPSVRGNTVRNQNTEARNILELPKHE